MTRLSGWDQEEGTQHKTSRIIQPELTNENQAFREVELKPITKRGTNRTAAPLSLYQSSSSLCSKQSSTKSHTN